MPSEPRRIAAGRARQLRPRGRSARPDARSARIVEHAAQIAGRVKASGTLRGDWSAPQATLSAQAEALELPGGLRRRARTPCAWAARPRGTASPSPRMATIPTCRRAARRMERTGVARRSSYRCQAPARWRSTRSRRRRSPSRASAWSSARLEARLEQGRLLVRELVRTQERVTSSGEFSCAAGGSGCSLRSAIASAVRSTLHPRWPMERHRHAGARRQPQRYGARAAT